MTRLVIAWQYLTVLPAPRAASPPEAPGTAAAWFPVVGLGMGALLVAVDRAAAALFPPLVGATLVVGAWKLLTGGLHLDGVADCLDGLGGRDAAQRLAIMRDSRIGVFGALGLILVILLDVMALGGIDPCARWRAVLVAPVIGRAIPPVMARVFPPASPAGHGARFRAELGAASVPIALAFALAVAALVLGARGAAALGVALLVTGALGAFMTRRLGGVSGDVHGAAVELAELTVLLTMAAVPA